MDAEQKVDQGRCFHSLQGLLESQELLHSKLQISLITDQHLSVPPPPTERKVPDGFRTAALQSQLCPLHSQVMLAGYFPTSHLGVPGDAARCRGGAQLIGLPGLGGKPADSVRHGDTEPEAKDRPQTFRDTESLMFGRNSAGTFHLFISCYFFNYCNSSTAVDFSSEQVTNVSFHRKTPFSDTNCFVV